MITKVCQFHAKNEQGSNLVQVFHPGEMERAAEFFSMGKKGAALLAPVQQYLERLQRHPNRIYVLANALGAGEFWSSNINGDYFPEAGLIHPGRQYGYETFYGAHPYKHHVNKDPSKSFGSVDLSCWHDLMKRVELVIVVDRLLATQHGAEDVVDKLDRGLFPDLSMGCRVPYDLCSICTDWPKYRAAQAKFRAGTHASVSQAVLQFHRRDPISGLAITRKDYCSHLLRQLNKILPDGRKVYMVNDYPRFFDISFVFIGADKTAKVMAKLASAMPYEGDVVPSWYLAEVMGYSQSDDQDIEKVASYHFFTNKPNHLAGVEAVIAKLNEKRASHAKGAEIIKDTAPSQFGSKAMSPLPSRPDLPRDVLNSLGSHDLSESLSTPTTLGMVLKPREFQRITIIRLGKPDLADKLDDQGLIFPPTDEVDSSIPVGAQYFSPLIKDLLLPHLEGRSALEPVAQRTVIRISVCPAPASPEPILKEAEANPFLSKIAAAYNGYLDLVVDCLRGTEGIVREHADVWSAVFRNGVADGFEKVGELGKVSPAVLLGSIGGAYLLSTLADWERRKAMMGARPPVGPIVDTIADYPKAMMFLAGLGALHQQGSDIPKRILHGLGALIQGK